MTRLLSDKDLDQIRRVQERGRVGLVLVRELSGFGGVSVHIHRPCGVWGLPYIIKLETWEPGMRSRQYFGDVSEIRR